MCIRDSNAEYMGKKQTLKIIQMESGAETDTKFVIKKFNPVGIWSWDIHVEVCAICRESLREPCLGCKTNSECKDECVLAWGKCNHCFHYHCISRWTKVKTTCPLDGTWELLRLGKIF
eukprot:TRINITY_DN18925_c0_g1_i1.p2 TRINITY_DN18925_c0_g1~~TRINITY_DN18925_c0_g1_i1.p2  ORF type:complete len:118 (+),score=15.58 TRINITY_DN18925_c0_g1_i1:145-498(+)